MMAAVCSEMAAIFSRRLAQDAPEGAMERSHRLEPDFISHFGHAARAVTQQKARIFDAAPRHIIPELKACGLVEQRAEMKHTGPASLRY